MGRKRKEVIIRMLNSGTIKFYTNKTCKHSRSSTAYSSFGNLMLAHYDRSFIVVSNLKPKNNRRTLSFTIVIDDYIRVLAKNKNNAFTLCTDGVKAVFGYIPKKLYFQKHIEFNKQSNLKKHEEVIQFNSLTSSDCDRFGYRCRHNFL